MSDAGSLSGSFMSGTTSESCRSDTEHEFLNENTDSDDADVLDPVWRRLMSRAAQAKQTSRSRRKTESDVAECALTGMSLTVEYDGAAGDFDKTVVETDEGLIRLDLLQPLMLGGHRDAKPSEMLQMLREKRPDLFVDGSLNLSCWFSKTVVRGRRVNKPKAASDKAPINIDAPIIEPVDKPKEKEQEQAKNSLDENKPEKELSYAPEPAKPSTKDTKPEKSEVEKKPDTENAADIKETKNGEKQEKSASPRTLEIEALQRKLAELQEAKPPTKVKAKDEDEKKAKPAAKSRKPAETEEQIKERKEREEKKRKEREEKKRQDEQEKESKKLEKEKKRKEREEAKRSKIAQREKERAEKEKARAAKIQQKEKEKEKRKHENGAGYADNRPKTKTKPHVEPKPSGDLPKDTVEPKKADEVSKKRKVQDGAGEPDKKAKIDNDNKKNNIMALVKPKPPTQEQQKPRVPQVKFGAVDHTKLVDPSKPVEPVPPSQVVQPPVSGFSATGGTVKHTGGDVLASISSIPAPPPTTEQVDPSAVVQTAPEPMDLTPDDVPAAPPAKCKKPEPAHQAHVPHPTTIELTLPPEVQAEFEKQVASQPQPQPQPASVPVPQPKAEKASASTGVPDFDDFMGDTMDW